MPVAPQDQPLIIEAQVDAAQIDQVRRGQEATLRFTAFNQRTTPEIVGQVTTVSADAYRNEATGMTFYRVELMPQSGELSKLRGQEMLPGMPVEAYLRTDERTPLSYLAKPLTDYFERAMREG